MKKANVLSLFDGISCARVALYRAGVSVNNYYSSEIDKYAIEVSHKNHPEIKQLGDIKNIDFKSIDKKIDLMIGGSPCQDLSIAKKDRKGLEGDRSSLFFDYVRILNKVKPRYFILENVNSMPKEAKDMITKTLFGIEPVMINAALVSAQNRKRLFWIGKLVKGGWFKKDTYKKVDIVLPVDRGILLRDILQAPAEVDDRMIVNGKSFALTATYNSAVAWNSIMKKQRTMVKIGQFGNGGQADRIYSPDGKSSTLSANGGGGGAKTGLYLVKAAAQRGRNIVDGKRKDILGAKTDQRIEIGGDKANTITSALKDSLVLENSTIRKLTPIECERLQSLPDNYTAGISNTQRYKCLGNAFNVNVVAHIINQL